MRKLIDPGFTDDKYPVNADTQQKPQYKPDFQPACSAN